MKQIWEQLKHYRLHYFLMVISIFFFGWLITTRDTANWGQNFFTSILYGLGISINAFIIETKLLPNQLYQKRKQIFTVSMIGLILTTGMIMLGLQFGFGQFKYILNVKNSAPISFILSYFFPLSFAAAFTTVIAIFRNQQLTILNMEKMHKEKLQTELNFLKAQINPHFLFNSLNSVYFLIEKENTVARNVLMKFTEMLRYQLYDCNVERINIEDEINFINNYIALQELRKGDKYRIKFEVGNNLTGFKIAPLILITFIENAFKYVSNQSTGENYIQLSLTKTDGILYFTCFNTTDQTAKPDIIDYGGIGVANTKRRLDILYPNHHELYIQQKSHDYTVHLKLKQLI